MGWAMISIASVLIVSSEWHSHWGLGDHVGIRAVPATASPAVLAWRLAATCRFGCNDWSHAAFSRRYWDAPNGLLCVSVMRFAARPFWPRMLRTASHACGCLLCSFLLCLLAPWMLQVASCVRWRDLLVLLVFGLLQTASWLKGR